MGVIRNTDQKSKTLRAFYTEVRDGGNAVSKGIGTLMLRWVERINEEFITTEIWGVTSHYQLVLQTENDYSSAAFVVIKASSDAYHIEYLIPEREAPWEHARIIGATKSLDEAMRMLKIALVNSGGWEMSDELKTH